MKAKSWQWLYRQHTAALLKQASKIKHLHDVHACHDTCIQAIEATLAQSLKAQLLFQYHVEHKTVLEKKMKLQLQITLQMQELQQLFFKKKKLELLKKSSKS